MTGINIDPKAVAFTVNMRARAGTVPGPDGNVPEADVEICVSLCVGVTKQASVLTAQGRQQGQMVPVATFTRPLSEFLADARMALGAAESEAPAAGLSLVP